MENKKHIKANLEKKKGVYSSIALLFALATVLVAFEYRTSSEIIKDDGSGLTIETFEEEKMVVSFVKPPPVQKKAKILSFLIDDSEDEDPIEFDDLGIDEEFKVTAIVEPTFDEEVIIEDNTPFIIVEKMPEFPGGINALRKYLSKNIKYPSMARDIGIKGGVYLGFIIDKDGSITDIKVLKGIGGGCDEEAVRVVEGMPAWNPGKQGGKKVRVQFYLPINFILN